MKFAPEQLDDEAIRCLLEEEEEEKNKSKYENFEEYEVILDIDKKEESKQTDVNELERTLIPSYQEAVQQQKIEEISDIAEAFGKNFVEDGNQTKPNDYLVQEEKEPYNIGDSVDIDYSSKKQRHFISPEEKDKDKVRIEHHFPGNI